MFISNNPPLEETDTLIVKGFNNRFCVIQADEPVKLSFKTLTNAELNYLDKFLEYVLDVDSEWKSDREDENL